MDKGLGVTHTVAKRRENTREIFPNATPLSSSSHSVEIQEYDVARIESNIGRKKCYRNYESELRVKKKAAFGFPSCKPVSGKRFNGQKLSFRLDLTLETVTVLTVRTSYQEAGKVGGGTRLTWIREIKAARTIGERVSFCNRVVAQPLFAIKPRYASPILGWASGWALYPAERKYDSGSPRFPPISTRSFYLSIAQQRPIDSRKRCRSHLDLTQICVCVYTYIYKSLVVENKF